jgi:hypothetical protein
MTAHWWRSTESIRIMRRLIRLSREHPQRRWLRAPAGSRSLRQSSRIFYHPMVLAKMALQIEHISRGRFAINLVNAWNRSEFEEAGIGFAEHDERYAYGREWISVLEALTRGETVSFNGKFPRR